MREALAQINNDFVISEPKAPKRPRKTARAAADERHGLFQRSIRSVFFAAKHANLFIGLLFAALLAAVFANALFWQKAPHPAPLFGHSIQIEPKPEAKAEPKPVEPKHEVPTPTPAARVAVSEPAQAPAEHPVVSPPHGRDPMAEAAELQNQKPSAAPVAHDPIAQLLKRPSQSQRSSQKPNEKPSERSSEKPSAAASSEPSKTVLAAQRALVKLGYVVKPDGVMRPATKQALEQFERDHNLPVHGTLSAKITHELAARSGIAVE